MTSYHQTYEHRLWQTQELLPLDSCFILVFFSRLKQRQGAEILCVEIKKLIIINFRGIESHFFLLNFIFPGQRNRFFHFLSMWMTDEGEY